MAKQQNGKEVSKGNPSIIFSKENIVKMERFRERKDILSILLEDTREYSVMEVESALEKFMKGKVK